MSRRISVALLPTRCGSGNRSESMRRMKWAKRSSSPWCGVAVSSSRWSVLAASFSAIWYRLVFSDLVAAPGTALRVRAALVRLVDDDEVPSFAQNALSDIVLFGVVERGDDLRRAMPGIDELLLIDGREDDVERFAEPAEQFVLPLDRQRRGAEDQHPVDGLAELHLLDEQARHDRLARTGVVRQQKAEPRLRQHPQVDGLDLVRQRADARQADGEVAVVRVGEADAGRLDDQAKAFGVDRLDRGRGLGLLAEDGGGFVARQNGLVRRAVGQADAALEPVAQGRGRTPAPPARRNAPAGRCVVRWEIVAPAWLLGPTIRRRTHVIRRSGSGLDLSSDLRPETAPGRV